MVDFDIYAAHMADWPIPDGRAVTPEQKREVIERVYAAWLAAPQQRLGQFIKNAVGTLGPEFMFSVEDDAIAAACERFVKTSRHIAPELDE